MHPRMRICTYIHAHTHITPAHTHITPCTHTHTHTHLVDVALSGGVHCLPNLWGKELVSGELQALSAELHETVGGIASAVHQYLGDRETREEET